MPDGLSPLTFPDLNRAYNTVFQPGRLSLGLVVPLEAYPASAVPAMDRHVARAELADALGFASLWLRDVPFNVPSFGDAGQMFDPFVYLGLLSGATRRIGPEARWLDATQSPQYSGSRQHRFQPSRGRK